MNPRPLVVRFGALGDMVILTVAIRHLHARFGQAVDIIGSGDWTQPLLAGQPGVGEIQLIGSRKRPLWLSFSQRQLLRGLHQRHPEQEVLLLGVPQESALNEAIIRMAGVSRGHNVVHEPSINKLIGLCGRATGMVSVDTEPFMYAPRGRAAIVECLVGERQGVRTMRFIEVQDVLSAWQCAVVDRARH